jgi:hypothetical protein
VKDSNNYIVHSTALLAVILLTLANTYALYVYGFGLHVRSWTALIVFGVFGSMSIKLLTDAVVKGTK